MGSAHAFGGALVADDFVAAQSLHMRRWRKRQYVVFPVLLLCGIVMVSSGWTAPGIVAIATTLVTSASLAALHVLWQPRVWTRLFEQQKNLHEPFSYTWDEAGLEASTPLGRAVRPWAHFMRHAEDARTILLYHSDAMFELIPKRWFDDTATLEALRTEISRHPFAARR